MSWARRSGSQSMMERHRVRLDHAETAGAAATMNARSCLATTWQSTACATPLSAFAFFKGLGPSTHPASGAGPPQRPREQRHRRQRQRRGRQQRDALPLEVRETCCGSRPRMGSPARRSSTSSIRICMCEPTFSCSRWALIAACTSMNRA